MKKLVSLLLPFPQNKNTGGGGDDDINLVLRRGRHKGEAHTNASEEDAANCGFGCCITDMKPKTLDPNDLYQQFEIRRRDWGRYVAKSIAPDGFSPNFLRRKGWISGNFR